MIFWKRSIFIASILIAAVLLSGPFLLVHPVKALDLPMHVHLTWQNETSTTMTVTWQTSTSTAGDIVKYDTVSHGGDPALYSYSAAGINYTYTGASGYIHDAELTGLAPNTTYYFICGGDTGGWSNERAFRTAPSVLIEPWMGTYARFVMGGDSRTNIAERDKISKAMAKFNPAFVMHDGDFVEAGDNQSQWDNWFTDVHDNWIGNNSELDNYGLTIPVIPAEGNHEDDSPKYYSQFALPGNEMYYSYDWGPDIHIIVLNSEKEELTEHKAEKQAAWLESDLLNHSLAMWKIAIFHRPPFVSGSHTTWTPARTWWVPLFDKYHVDLVLNGHEHSYQRSYPLNWTASQTESQDYSNGTEYIVSGAWGAPLYDPKPIWYMAYQNKTYHFCLVEINGTSLHLQTIDNQGNTFDEITVTKVPLVGAIARFRYTPQRNLPYVNETVNFDASDSRVCNGTHYLAIANYTWDFGDGMPLVTEIDPITTYNFTAPGEYTVILNITALNTTDNSVIWDTESHTIKVYLPGHNIVLASVVPTSTKHGPPGSPYIVTEAYSTWTIDIAVTLENNGTFPESFTVEAFYGNATGNYSLGIISVSLPEVSVKTVTFVWDLTDPYSGYPNYPAPPPYPGAAFPYPVYSIYANASVVLNETDTADNTKASVQTVKIKWVADVDGDGDCDIHSLLRLTDTWYKGKTDPMYNPQCDWNGDVNGATEIFDLLILTDWWYKGPII